MPRLPASARRRRTKASQSFSWCEGPKVGPCGNKFIREPRRYKATLYTLAEAGWKRILNPIVSLEWKLGFHLVSRTTRKVCWHHYLQNQHGLYALRSKIKRNGENVFYFVTDNEFFGEGRLRTRDPFRLAPTTK